MGKGSEFFAAVIGVGLVCGMTLLALVLWMIGADSLRIFGLIFIVGIVAVAVIAASALPIRAYRKRDTTGETHHWHEGVVTKETRIIDGRAVEGPKFLQLPAPQGEGFPELLRAAWQAGALGHQVEVEPIETDNGNGQGGAEHWDGEIEP